MSTHKKVEQPRVNSASMTLMQTYEEVAKRWPNRPPVTLTDSDARLVIKLVNNDQLTATDDLVGLAQRITAELGRRSP
jgi:hypothetical protein